MPTNKDFKRLVRRRMQKTGEAYTAARAQLLKTRSSVKTSHDSTSRESSARPAVRADYATLAGMSDAALEAKTGCTWERWVKALDHAKAHTWPHRKIAEYVHEKFEVSRLVGPDASPSATSGFAGLRDIGQRRGGSYEATKSKTFAVPVGRLFDAFAKARMRAKWLPGVKLTVRKTVPDKSVRMTWEDGTSVEVWLIAKGAGKSSATVQHRKLLRQGVDDPHESILGRASRGARRSFDGVARRVAARVRGQPVAGPSCCPAEQGARARREHRAMVRPWRVLMNARPRALTDLLRATESYRWRTSGSPPRWASRPFSCSARRSATSSPRTTSPDWRVPGVSCLPWSARGDICRGRPTSPS